MDFLTQFVSSLEEKRAFTSKPKMSKLRCSKCHRWMIETRFDGHIVALCDNAKGRCPLFRRPQKIRGVKSRITWPSYPNHLKRRKPERHERYVQLREHGLSSIQASIYRDVTSMTVEEIAEMFKHDN